MKPNVLILMVDELRYPQHENDEIREWRRQYLKTQTFMEEQGYTFKNHYTSSTACEPSRTTLFTGQYPSLHGVTQTSGGAKTQADPDWFGLEPGIVPTMGSYFNAAGYCTLYKGKWHMSNADIMLPGSHVHLTTYNDVGAPFKPNIDMYESQDTVSGFQFHGYIGPEPDTTDSYKSGSSSIFTPYDGRDIFYTQEVIKLLDEMEILSNTEDSTKPWLMVASLINPHDICLYGEFTEISRNYNFYIDPSVPYIPQSPTAHQDLTTTPPCQKEYKKLYKCGFQPLLDTEKYRKLYYSLNLQADKNHKTILDKLKRTKFYDNTIILFLSDHGDYLGSHGLFQKWYSMYEEALHIPFYVKLPKSMQCISRNNKTITEITTHVDVLPTLLGLCGLDQECLLKKLRNTHLQAKPLVGRNLSGLMINTQLYPRINNDPILFITNDNVFLGQNMICRWTGQPYLPINQPCNIAAIVIKLNGCIYKYAKYYDDPKFWTVPTVQNNFVIKNVITTVDGITYEHIESIIYTVPVNPLYEMYNITEDPLEINNLANSTDPEIISLALKLRHILEAQMSLKLLTPTFKVVDPLPAVIPITQV